MKVAVYALMLDPGRRIGGRGISGERLRSVRVGTVAAVVGDVARPPAPSEARLRAYAALVARLAARHQAILPVRFGTVMQDEAELQTVLRARGKTIRSQLLHVRGRVQMTVRIVVRNPPPVARARRSPGEGGSDSRGGPRSQTGTEYLLSRARTHSASSIPGFAPLSRAVARWVKDERVDPRGNIATVYQLIPRAAAGRYAAAIEGAAAAEGVRAVISGPWPPHAFADDW